MRKQKGFTLTELVLLLMIIGIVAWITIPALASQWDRTRVLTAVKNAGHTEAVTVVKIERLKDGTIVGTVQNRDRTLTKYHVKVVNEKPVLVQ